MKNIFAINLSLRGVLEPFTEKANIDFLKEQDLKILHPL